MSLLLKLLRYVCVLRREESMKTVRKSKSIEIQIFPQSLIFQYTKKETAGLGYLIKARGREEKSQAQGVVV